MISNFWENERPSSTDDESETENLGERIVRNIEAAKDLSLSKNEFKSEIGKIGNKINSYHKKLRSQKRINRRLTREIEQLQNELQSFKGQFNLFANGESYIAQGGVFLRDFKHLK